MSTEGRRMSSGFTHESTHNESQEWYTPPQLFTALGLQFDLDPCGAPTPYKDFVTATRRLTIIENGLVTPWEGTVFMNPPYGQLTPKWMARFIQHGNGIALVFSRTDTAWFHMLPTQALLCFVKGRIKFRKPDGTVAGTPGAGSLLIGMGEVASAALLQAQLGRYCRTAI